MRNARLLWIYYTVEYVCDKGVVVDWRQGRIAVPLAVHLKGINMKRREPTRWSLIGINEALRITGQVDGGRDESTSANKWFNAVW